MKDTAAEVKLSFYDHHRQAYYHLPLDGCRVAEFLIGDYVDDGCVNSSGQFLLEAHRFERDEFLSLRICCFGDGFGALTKALEMGLGEILQSRLTSRAEVSEALTTIGIADKSQFAVGEEPVPDEALDSFPQPISKRSINV